MRSSYYKILFSLVALFGNSDIFAQVQPGTETGMRSHDKIYVVVVICVTILAGLFLYLVSIDRKIGRIEDKQ